MAAPRGRSYTPKSGPLAGQTFTAPAGARGQTAAYNVYQNALARHYGAPSYGALKTQRANPAYRLVFNRALGKDYDRSAAHNAARRIIGNDRIPKGPRQGKGSTRSESERNRMRQVISQLYREGLYDNGDDAADDLYYE